MDERLVVNTGPLIALASAEALPIVRRLPVQLLAPFEVRDELDEGARSGRRAVDIQGIAFLALAAPPGSIALANLDSGEAAVIQLALDQRVGTVCIDERKGRRAALAVGLRVVGSLALLGRAKVLGLTPAVRPLVERMLSSGTWFDQALLEHFYRSIGE